MWKAISVGCHVPIHLCPLVLTEWHQWGWCWQRRRRKLNIPPSAQSTLSPPSPSRHLVFSVLSPSTSSENLVTVLCVTGEVNSTNYLKQRLPVAVQHSNSAAVLGTMGNPTSVCGPLSLSFMFCFVLLS